MIYYINKDVTTVEQGIVIHGVNCQGVMGSGVAKAVRAKWPQVYQSYKELVEAYYMTRSQLLGSAQYIKVGEKLYVGNWFSQVSFGHDGQKYADSGAIQLCLFNSIAFFKANNLPVYMPRIGCGLGGLNWNEDVEPVLTGLLDEFPMVDVYVCDI